MAKESKSNLPVVVSGIAAALINDIVSALRRGGLRPDIPDIRDWPIERAIPRGLCLPTSFDQRGLDSAVENQLSLGSCTAQAGIGALEYLENLTSGSHAELSALALYFWERQAMGTVSEDSGASLRQCIKQLAQGVCRLELCPYDIAKFAADPGEEAVADRLNHRAGAYYRIGDLNRPYHIKAALLQGFAVVCGISVYESMMTDAVAKSGAVPMPRITESLLGGHAIRLVSYDDARAEFGFRNSWGESWGDKGYGTLPAKFVGSPQLLSDVWAVQRIAPKA